jgi:SAM-dependent methyltransferase
MNKQKQIAELAYGNILDVGYAQSPNLLLKGKKVVGVDIQVPLKQPKNYTGLKVLDLNKDKLPFRKSTFHTVILGDVIEHVYNPTELLRECNRVLIAGGRLIVTTPHATEWWTILHNMCFTSLKDSDEGEHLSNWTKLDMIRLLNVNGFKKDAIWGTHMRLPLFPSVAIPTKYSHFLSWILFYSFIKVKDPNSYIITKDESGQQKTI